MPIYDYECTTHGKFEDIWAKMDEQKSCTTCGKKMKRLFTGQVRVIPDITPYLDENISTTPILVKSRQHRKQLMKEHGLFERG
jgi:putative FmdB family regulatory protein